MNIGINLILLAVIVCFIVDLSGVVDSIKHFIWKRWIKVGDYHQLSLKPLSCSLCSVWWTGLLYLLLTPGAFTIPWVFAVAMLSLFSSRISGFLQFLLDAFDRVLELLYKNAHIN